MDRLIESLDELIPVDECEPFEIENGVPVILARTDTASLIRTYIEYGPLTTAQWSRKSEEFPHLFAPLSAILDGRRWSSWEAFVRTCWSADWKSQLNMWVEIRIIIGRWLSNRDAREFFLISMPLIEQGTGQSRSELKKFYSEAIAAVGLTDLQKEEAN